jgi:hypothetical protein
MRGLMVFMLLALSSPVAAQTSVNLKPAHPERCAISVLLKEGRSDVIEPFRIKTLRYVRTKTQDFAYVDTVSTYDREMQPFHRIMVRKKGQRWKTVWGEGANGSNTCKDAIRHFEWAIAYFNKNGVRAKEFAPELLLALADFQKTAKTDDEDIGCAGDFEGGPQ